MSNIFGGGGRINIVDPGRKKCKYGPGLQSSEILFAN